MPVALGEAQDLAVDDLPPVLPLSYLVLTKLLASRVQDIADVTRMLRVATAKQLDEVRDVVARHLPDASEDLESLLELGKLEDL